MNLDSIAGSTHDIYTDGGKLLVQMFGGAANIPEALRKTATVDPEHLGADDFALVVFGDSETVRRMPIHDKEHLATSAIYLDAQEPTMPELLYKEAKARIRNRMRQFGIDPPDPDALDAPGTPVYIGTVDPRPVVEKVSDAALAALPPQQLPHQAISPLLSLVDLRKTASAAPGAYDVVTDLFSREGPSPPIHSIELAIDQADATSGLTHRPPGMQSPSALVQSAIKLAEAEPRQRALSMRQFIGAAQERKEDLSDLIGEPVYTDLLENPKVALRQMPPRLRQEVMRIITRQ